MLVLTRPVSARLAACELTHLVRRPIDPERAARQHGEYERALRALGCRVEPLPPAPDLPDSVFVEDVAVVLPEVAVITRPGAPSRRAETAAVRERLARERPVHSLAAPGTLDGGDVLRVDDLLLVGRSARTDARGVAQLRAVAEPLGYRVVEIPVRGCLHLKTAATRVAPGRVLINPEWVDRGLFQGLEVLEVDAAEPYGANVLRIGEAALCSASYPRTRRRLEREGIDALPLDISELEKAEAGLTCLGLLVDG